MLTSWITIVSAVLASQTTTAPSGSGAPQSRPVAAPPVEQYLVSGELAKGEEAMLAALKANPRDDQARFGLGVVQLMRGVERLMQAQYHYGMTHFRELGPMFPGSRVPLPDNPSPKKLSYADARAVVQTFVDDLAKTEKTLADVADPAVKLPLRFGLFRIDLDGDGTASDSEAFWFIFAAVSGADRTATFGDAEKFVIAFDAADVQWLRGYCHLLSGLCEIALAYDEKELFERVGHVFFPNNETPHEYLHGGTKVFGEFGLPFDIADMIAFIHLINFPVKEPARLKAALEHFEAMIDRSRAMWKITLAETDDDREWIPNPRQTGVIPGLSVTPEMTQAWTVFLDEAAALLAGKKLVPFWRTNDGRGVNLRRVFTEPTPLDAVLWVQGTAATPYLEKGELTTRETWDRLMRVFEGEFIGFALWFN